MIWRCAARRKQAPTSRTPAASGSTPARLAGGLLGGEVGAERAHAAVGAEVVVGHVGGEVLAQARIGLGGEQDRERLVEEALQRPPERGEDVGPVALGDAAVAERPQRLEARLEDRLHEPGLVGVVVVDARLRDAGALGDLARGQAADALLADELERGGEDRLAAAGRRPAAAPGCVGCHHREG
jgi:hypothetical protein